MFSYIEFNATFYDCDIDWFKNGEEELLQKIKKVIPEAKDLLDVGLFSFDMKLIIDLVPCRPFTVTAKQLKKTAKILKAKTYVISVV